jgi:hypothetical protein
VTVTVTIPGDPGIVILRGLTINGVRNHAPQPPPPPPPPPETGGSNGVQFLAGGKLVIDHCNIYGFKLSGIDVSAASGNLVVRNTTLTGNKVGIHLASTTGAGMRAEVTNSLIAGNTGPSMTGYGVHAEQGTISVANSLLTNNDVAVSAVTSGRVRLSNNEIFDNAMGLQGCGRIASAGNNKRAGSPGCSPSAAPIFVE